MRLELSEPAAGASNPWAKLPALIEAVGDAKSKTARVLDLSDNQRIYWTDALGRLGFRVTFIADPISTLPPTPSPFWHRGQILWAL
jgi:hypothetical protein